MRLEELNALPEAEARTVFLRCSGSGRWAERMTAARPFADRDTMMAIGDIIWSALGREDWLEAFASHPRIGEQRAGAAGALAHRSAEREGGWAVQEQSGAADADAAVKKRLAERNRDYEARFGYIFIVCATGKSAPEMLAILEGRLSNEFDHELAIAAEQQRQITRLRLAKLLDR